MAVRDRFSLAPRLGPTWWVRVEKLRSRPLQKWAGVHVAGLQYSEASLVTRQGSLWVATATTTLGEGGDWRLIVKKGDAR
jgi:hypothetical protein